MKRIPRLHLHPRLLAFIALVWFLARTGGKPARITYPCQQAAMGSAWLLLGLPLAHSMHRLARRLRSTRMRHAAVLSLALLLGVAGLSDTGDGSFIGARKATKHLHASADYVARLYVVENALGLRGDHHAGIDQLFDCMGADGLKLYRSASLDPESGPDGIVEMNDVVLIKVNAQWSQRGGTNTDVLKGLIAKVLEHPDGFVGEVVVVENTQGGGSFDWTDNNAEDTGQSVIDVVNHFAGLGWPVSAYLWDDIRTTAVSEYADGDSVDGYVVGPWNPEVEMCVSYPKFRTASGHHVSLARGVWDSVAGGYDPERLVFINVPVLKTHGLIYGVTASVKNQVGTMTTALGTNTHLAVRHGGPGAFLAQVRMPDLNILDCIYVHAHPSSGPQASYAQSVFVNKLVAGRDPVALDLWATTHILVPAMIGNGYTEYPKQDPNDSLSIFRTYLDNAADQLLGAGIEVTNDAAQISAQVCQVVGREAGEAKIGTPFPNPFTTSTSIRFKTWTSGNVRFDVYDVAGRLRRSMPQSVGGESTGEFRWDGCDDAGHRLTPGTYFYRVGGAGSSASGRVTLAR